MARLNRLAAATMLLAVLAPTPALARQKAKQGPQSLNLGTPPTPNVSPMALGLQCTRTRLDQQNKTLRISVGDVRDFTGKFSNEASEGGFKITQGGSLMVISALGQLGQHVELIERYDTRIAEQEIALARNQLIQDGVQSAVVRPVTAGQYVGSDYYIVGGVTEANYNIGSGGAEVRIMGVGGGGRYYAMNVAADLRLVDARTLRVVKTVSVQKQFIGREIKADSFSFFGGATLIDINAGTKKNEPLQLGVRATIEYGVLDLISAAFGLDFQPCQAHADYGFERGVQPRLVDEKLTGSAQVVSLSK